MGKWSAEALVKLHTRHVVIVLIIALILLVVAVVAARMPA